MKSDKTSFFSSSDGEWFVGNDATRGPWSADACHAGPVTGLLVRALENAGTDKQIVRITANYLRPVPMSGFRVDAAITRNGRSAAMAEATLTDADGRPCANASSLHLISSDYDTLPTSTIESPSRQQATSGNYAVGKANHDLSFFRDWIDIAYPPGEKNTDRLSNDVFFTTAR